MKTLKQLMLDYPIKDLMLAIRALKAKYPDYTTKEPKEKVRLLEAHLKQ